MPGSANPEEFMAIEEANPALQGEISISEAQSGLLSDVAKAAEGIPVETPEVEPEQEETAAPEEEAPSEEAEVDEETTDENEPDELPAIDPPASWKQSERDRFSDLPRDVQQVIAERERSREVATNRALQEAAELRKSADAEKQAAAYQRHLYQQQLENVLPGLQSAIHQEFAEIKTPADVLKMAQEEPDRYSLWRARRDALEMAQQEQAQLAQQQHGEREAARNDYIAKAETRLVDAIPEWKDTVRGKKEIGELHAYLQDEYSVPREVLAQMVEPYHYQVARKAMLYDKAQTAKAKAVSNPVPKVQRPGTPKTKSDQAAEGMDAIMKRLDKTGDIEDALRLMTKG